MDACPPSLVDERKIDSQQRAPHGSHRIVGF
jgi:hypothetical protein